MERRLVVLLSIIENYLEQALGTFLKDDRAFTIMYHSLTYWRAAFGPATFITHLEMLRNIGSCLNSFVARAPLARY